MGVGLEGEVGGISVASDRFLSFRFPVQLCVIITIITNSKVVRVVLFALGTLILLVLVIVVLLFVMVVLLLIASTVAAGILQQAMHPGRLLSL